MAAVGGGSWGMSLAWSAGMGLATATIEMETPEAHRERLHDLLKATRTVLVLSGGRGGERSVEQPMVLVRTADDTTMYLATSLDSRQVAALMRDPRITVVVQGAVCAVFDAEATISRDRQLIDGLGTEWWKGCGRARSDPSIAILVISPIAGAYWDGARRNAYQYRLSPPAPQRELSDGVPVEV